MKVLIALTVVALVAVADALPAVHEDDGLSRENAMREGVLTTIKEYIEEIITRIKEMVNDLIEKAKSLVQDVMDKVSSMSQNAVETISNLITSTDATIMGLAAKGASYKECIRKYEPKVSEVYQEAKDTLKSCPSEAIEYALYIHGSIIGEVAQLKDQFVALRDIVQDCLDPLHPIGSVTCAVDKASIVQDTVSLVIEKAFVAFNAATTVSSVAYSCIADTLATAKAQSHAVVEEIKTCASKTI